VSLSSPRGTSDIFGEEIKYRDFIISKAKDIFKVFNFKEIITPAFEYTELFDRGIGEGTDIVQKEMYTFADKKGRSLTLRPEGTASVVRAIIENKLYAKDLPLKLFYIGNMFRYERPQKGRSREFWQVGVEVFGQSQPILDAEVIWLLNSFYKNLGFKNLKLLLNSIGCVECRPSYIKSFKEYIKPRMDMLCSDCRFRFDKSPLRIFDCKKDGCRKILEKAPKINDNLCDNCVRYFKSVKKYLDSLEIDYEIDSGMVRGFDYYSRTIFEIISLDIDSAQNALAGGGRYDYLVKEFSGPDLPAVGFAIGLDRTIIQMKKLNISVAETSKKKSTYIVTMKKDYYEYSLMVMRLLRDNNIICDLEYENKNIGPAIKKAEKLNYDYLMIIGDDEVKNNSITLKDIKKYKQYEIDLDNKNRLLEMME